METPKRGRPRRPVPLKKITNRIPPEDYEVLWDWAHAENSTITALTARILQEAIAARREALTARAHPAAP